MDNLSDLWEYMTPEEQSFARNAISSYTLPIWSPLAGPQTLAYESEADIIGYGGAAGGGKTDLAIGKVLRQHKRSIVYRLNGTEHTAFIDRLEEILGTRDGFNSKDGVWRIDAGGRKLQMELGSTPNPGDEGKYRGRPHDLKVFDEVSEQREAAVRFLMGWTRTTDITIHPQVLMCFNPPTSAEGRWVIDFFAPWLKRNHPRPALPGELRWFATINGKDREMPDARRFVLDDTNTPIYDFNERDYTGNRKTLIIKPLSRTFIPARVTDNPYYADGPYMSQLQALPEPLRSQMLNGDFQAGVTDDVWQVIPTKWVEMAMARWKDRYPKPEMDSMGIDVARGGKDKTVISRRHAKWYDHLLTYPGKETPDGYECAALVIAAARDGAPQHIDVIGVGASPYDILNQTQHVFGVDVRVTSNERDKSGKLTFKNLRSQLIWQMREELDPGNNSGIELPPDDELKADLTSFTWRPQGTVIKVESREEVYDRIKRSPDKAVAVFLARLDTPKRSIIEGVLNQRVADYNPYENM